MDFIPRFEIVLIWLRIYLLLKHQDQSTTGFGFIFRKITVKKLTINFILKIVIINLEFSYKILEIEGLYSSLTYCCTFRGFEYIVEPSYTLDLISGQRSSTLGLRSVPFLWSKTWTDSTLPFHSVIYFNPTIFIMDVNTFSKSDVTDDSVP